MKIRAKQRVSVIEAVLPIRNDGELREEDGCAPPALEAAANLSETSGEEQRA